MRLLLSVTPQLRVRMSTIGSTLVPRLKKTVQCLSTSAAHHEDYGRVLEAHEK